MSQYYSHMAELLEYPYGKDFGFTETFMQLAGNSSPVEREYAAMFLNTFTHMTPQEKEELYVSCFDVQAVCCLDVGYAVFGEDYKRGQLMAELKVLHRDHNNECGSELPDFLPNMLRLIPKLPYGDAAELAQHIVIPAVAKMKESFTEEGNPYRLLLSVVEAALRRDFDCREEATHV